MSDKPDPSGPQFRADRPTEQEAVRTTIVGGRPPGSGQSVGAIPRGMEVLVKKAAVDPEFRALLLERRDGAAETIGLDLDPAEVMMLRAVPGAQLESIIARTVVPQQHRRAFLGTAAAAMLATLGIGAAGCGSGATKGVRPDRPPVTDGIRPERVPVTGSAPDRPPPKEEPSTAEPDEPPDESVKPMERPAQPPAPTGIRPDPPPPTRGIQPDRP